MTTWLIIRLALALIVVAGMLLVGLRFALDKRRFWPNGGGGWDPDTYGMSAHRWVGRRAYLNAYTLEELSRPGRYDELMTKPPTPLP